jgi:hypothetical protein
VLCAPKPARLAQLGVAHKAIGDRKLVSRAKLGLCCNLALRFLGRLLVTRDETDDGYENGQNEKFSVLHDSTPLYLDRSETLERFGARF